MLPFLNLASTVATTLVVAARREGGQTMAEYGVLIAAIAIVVALAAATFGTSITGLFSSTAHKV
jgi:Flp pilus assembly pilin Flp